MNLMRYFEGPRIKAERAMADDLKTMVALAKNERLKAERELRDKFARNREALERSPIARAMGRKENGDD